MTDIPGFVLMTGFLLGFILATRLAAWLQGRRVTRLLRYVWKRGQHRK